MDGVHFRVDLAPFRRSMSAIARRQVPFALSQALNDTAKDVTEAWGLEVEQKLDRPTPFTKKGTYVRRATKARPVAEVGYKPIQAAYLRKQYEGGTRRPKRRAILVPEAQRLNKYGNMPKGAVAKVLARSDTFVASRKKRRTAHLKPGVYKRARRRAGRSGGANAPQLLIAFANSARYRKRLRLRHEAKRTVQVKFRPHFYRRFRAAMATAR